MSTAPFDPSVATLVTDSHTQYVTLDYSLDEGTSWQPLDLVDGEVGWVERRSPRVIADVVIADPGRDVIEDLDPLTFVLGRFTVTYVLPDGKRDAQEVARLQLRVRGTQRPDGALRLTFASAEAFLIDGASPPLTVGGASGNPAPISVDPLATIKSWLEGMPYAGGPLDPLTVVVEARARTNVDAPGDYGPDDWSWLQGIADTAGLDMFDNGDLIMRIADRPVVATTSAARFVVGAGSTLLTSDSTVSREDWANYVILRYSYDATSGSNTYPTALFGTAKISSGPYGWAAAGIKVHYEEFDGRPTQLSANLRAAEALRLRISLARGLTLTAVPHWWLRPGDTVSVQLPASDEARHIVSEVSFDLGRKDMRLVTRVPDNSPITAGE